MAVLHQAQAAEPGYRTRASRFGLPAEDVDHAGERAPAAVGSSVTAWRPLSPATCSPTSVRWSW